ncbi:MAG: Maf family nucleotide pyrophosphatase [Cytophagales bacterium]|nr:Maf family nucleotide pyrophosphatase [Cytophagales bacterium]
MNNNISKIILASGSPRRKEILSQAGYHFEVMVKNIDETYPDNILLDNVAEYLAAKKAKNFADEAQSHTIICADTIVIFDNAVLGKPLDEQDAVKMLQKLSGNVHKVVTGVCILHQDTEVTFSDSSLVEFVKLDIDQIKYYIQKYKPMDKAGAYGIQDWIGMVGIKSIYGSFYNVMGLPIHLIDPKIKHLKA